MEGRVQEKRKDGWQNVEDDGGDGMGNQSKIKESRDPNLHRLPTRGNSGKGLGEMYVDLGSRRRDCEHPQWKDEYGHIF